jgi:7-cyano-7-deazaguanine synthase
MKSNISDKPKAIVLLSGGMDSLVCAGIARELGYELAFLHLNYGQKTAQKELSSFETIADYFNIPLAQRRVIDATFLKLIGGSSLTDEKIAVADAELNNKEVPTSYVPFRNTIITSIAISWAEVIGAEKIFIGAVSEDHTGYPDCRPEYFNCFNKLIELGSQNSKIKIETPIIFMSKKEIVAKGIKLNLPFELTWSCYASQIKPCMKCDSCYLRNEGFKANNLVDPLLK